MGKLQVQNTIKGLKDANGNTLTEKDEVVKRWQEYTKDLYGDPDRTFLPVKFSEPLSGNPFAIDEVTHAMRHMKASKAAGPDELTLEMFQTLGEDGLHVLTSLFNAMYDTGKIPTERQCSTFITFPKNNNASECADFQTISLISYCPKIFLKILIKRLKGQIHHSFLMFYKDSCQTDEQEMQLFFSKLFWKDHYRCKRISSCVCHQTNFDRVKHNEETHLLDLCPT